MEKVLSPRNPSEIFRNGASPSMVEKWMNCKRKFYNYYVRKVRDQEKPSSYLTYGKAYDIFLKSYYDPDVPYNETKAIAQFKKDFPKEDDTDKRTQASGIVMIKAYAKRYPIKLQKVIAIDKGFGQSKGLSIEVPGMKLKLNVRLDLEFTAFGKPWVQEFKTTTNLGARYFDQYRNNYQVYCYLYAQQVVRGETGGIVLDAIAARPKLVEYKPAQLLKDAFTRMEFTFSPDQITYHMNQFAGHVNEMYDFVYENFQDPDKFLMNATGNACQSYNSTCPYLESCVYNGNPKLLIKEQFSV